MIAVLFEAFPRQGKWDVYLDRAAQLKSELSKIEGFISIERFQSLAEPDKVLSVSFWKDEESITQWRNLEVHRAAQKEGRISIFDTYRIRIAHIHREYGMHDREQAPADSSSIYP